MQALVRMFGAGFVLSTLAAAEYADRNKYHGQPDAGHMSADEHHHAAVVQTLAHGGDDPDLSQGVRIAAAESWHKGVSSGNDLRAAVLGANDGLVSNFCLIMGVAGAGTGNKAILLTGLAGLIAGACSMALGEWLSVTNARELASTQIAKEAEELEVSPEAEEHELALIYRAKGRGAGRCRRHAACLNPLPSHGARAIRARAPHAHGGAAAVHAIPGAHAIHGRASRRRSRSHIPRLAGARRRPAEAQCRPAGPARKPARECQCRCPRRRGRKRLWKPLVSRRRESLIVGSCACFSFRLMVADDDSEDAAQFRQCHGMQVQEGCEIGNTE